MQIPDTAVSLLLEDNVRERIHAARRVSLARPSAPSRGLTALIERLGRIRRPQDRPEPLSSAPARSS